ncbi:hypothetical protein MASR2M79_03610 [Aminivibrio sp.]
MFNGEDPAVPRHVPVEFVVIFEEADLPGGGVEDGIGVDPEGAGNPDRRFSPGRRWMQIRWKRDFFAVEEGFLYGEPHLIPSPDGEV